MRLACLAIGLSLWAAIAPAQVIEDRRSYPGTGERVLRIVSTADLDVFDPYLRAFGERYPEITVDYAVASSVDVNRMVRDGAEFDLALSSAMDLQFLLANDGFAQPLRTDVTASLPDWARWRDLIFAFTAEPAVVVLSASQMEGLPMPRTRQDLLALLRDSPERFAGAVGTYDVRESGLGYLFATQDARATDAYWRLSEVMGRVGPQLYCCSGQMIDDIAKGELALAYNVLGSYAANRLEGMADPDLRIVRLADFANVMLRTALVTAQAQEVEAAGAFIDMLATLGLREEAGDWPLPPLRGAGEASDTGFGPIRLGPALIVALDPLNRRTFLAEWENAMEQE
ncbi:ABC transporter substrate-binding protein [Roseobacter sp. HKCCA0434]|uniref:ABC transporter substrate-binding protein n=1 Tax=Roseobacter sp. HKCCA0434 TaxID=3079297 RepID=UPI002905EDF2|nr:ABC transporter substrate-binding protein [Roseobacter sp. HKCCA0434]